jgi:hypothetical protein
MMYFPVDGNQRSLYNLPSRSEVIEDSGHNDSRAIVGISYCSALTFPGINDPYLLEDADIYSQYWSRCSHFGRLMCCTHIDPLCGEGPKFDT